MKNPFVSVVLCVYNEEEDLPGCLESLEKQAFHDFEIVVVDDGSTDKTVEIAKKHSLKKKQNLRIIKQKHLGLGAARNNGVKNARGKIVAFLDADMRFDKEYLGELIQPILDKKCKGTTHGQEYANNLENPWARCWGRIRILEGYKDPKNYRAIGRSVFLKSKGFDPAWGYADDQSLTAQLGPAAIASLAVCYHRNPSTLKDTFKQCRWIGGSYSAKKIRTALAFLLIPYAALLAFFWKNFFIPFISATLGILTGAYAAYILYSTVRASIREKDATLLYLYPLFNTVRAAGILAGILRKATKKAIMM